MAVAPTSLAGSVVMTTTENSTALCLLSGCSLTEKPVTRSKFRDNLISDSINSLPDQTKVKVHKYVCAS